MSEELEAEPEANVEQIPSSRENEVTMTILEAGRLYFYRIPSFAVITVKLRRLKYECTTLDGSVKVVDGFIRDDPSLNRPFPAKITFGIGCEYACTVDVSF